MGETRNLEDMSGCLCQSNSKEYGPVIIIMLSPERVTSYLKVERSVGEHQELGGHVRMPVPEQLTTPTKHQLVLEAVWRQSVQNSVFLRFATTCTTPPS